MDESPSKGPHGPGQVPGHGILKPVGFVPPKMTPPPQAPQQATPPPPPQKENIKETIESILVAFILAFVFRAFVVEAFVIPSGSMAPTLLGGHMRFRCE